MVFFTSWSALSRRNRTSAPESAVWFRAAIRASDTARVLSPSSPSCSQLSRAAFRAASEVVSRAALAWVLTWLRCWSTDRHMPREYSALFSKRELDRAGP